MTLFFVLLLLLPLGFVIWDIVGAKPEEAGAVAEALPSAGALIEPGAFAARPVAAVRGAALPATAATPATPALVPPVAAEPAAQPRRYADTTLSPELAQIVASLSAAYPAPGER